MGISVADAYAQIKALENSGKLTLPQTKQTVDIGTIDPASGTFKWMVPTVQQTTRMPPLPNGKPSLPIEATVGVVHCNAVDLLLKFTVIPQKTQVASAPPAAEGKATTSPTVAMGTLAAAAPISGIGIVGSTTIESNGGVTVSTYPTVADPVGSITVNAGLICSVAIPGQSELTPPVTTFGITISFPAHPALTIRFFVLRPPAVALGAFTIPALPMTIVYAPPQGKQLKNSATYADTATVTRTVTSSITSSNSTKSVQAYTIGDLISKVAGAITAVVAVVGTGGAGAAGGASVAGAFSELGTALFGGAQTANDSAANDAKQVSSELSLVSDVLNGVDQTIPSNNGTISTESDHSITLTLSNLNQWGSEAALGAGIGDRIVSMTNLKVIWAAVNGDIGISILGFDGFSANSVQDLQQEAQSLAAGNAPRLGMDAATIQALLAMDPMVPGPPRSIIGRFGPAIIGPPRFIPANPPFRTGSGTGATGDIFQATYETTTDDKVTTTNTQTTITDAKPGWIDVIFGADNTETTTSATFTTNQTTDNKTDDKIVSTITLFSEGADDAYNVEIFYDRTFGTYLMVNSNSPLLQGGSVVIKPVSAEPAIAR